MAHFHIANLRISWLKQCKYRTKTCHKCTKNPFLTLITAFFCILGLNIPGIAAQISAVANLFKKNGSRSDFNNTDREPQSKLIKPPFYLTATLWVVPSATTI